MKTLYVGNLPYETTEVDLAGVFGQHADLESVQVIRDRTAGLSKGFAFVNIQNDDAYDGVVEALNQKEIGGRVMIVNEARHRVPRSTPEPEPPDEAGDEIVESVIPLTFNNEIFRVSAEVDLALVRHFEKYPNDLKTMDRRLFEQLVAELWDGFGYKVELTQQTRDGGKDVIALGQRLVNEMFLIECKRPDPGHKIGVRPVRELYAVKTSERATKAILATTAFFTDDAVLLFEKHRWELEGRDFDGIIGWIKEYMTLKNAQQGPST